MLNEHLRAVERLAGALIELGRVEGKRIAEIIDNAMRAADNWRGAS
jgi:hypothetical protein